MRVSKLDLISMLCYVLAAMAWVLLPNHPTLIGALLAVPFVFLLPGYAVTRVLFCGPPSAPSASSSPGPVPTPGRPLGAIDLIAFSLGLSLVIDIFVGFLLNLTPVGLQWQSWTLSLACVTEVFTLVAVFLRLRQGSPYRQIAVAHRRIHLRVHLKQGALLLSALVIAALALRLANIRPPQPQPSFTQLWMLPSTAARGCAVQIGVRSFETAPLIYRLEVTSNGQELASWPSITLSAQQEWVRQLPVSPIPAGQPVVDVQLYRQDQPGTIYREVHIMLHNCG